MRAVEKIIHPIAAVWNADSEVLILGTMPSPKSREEGFYYMHPQNRFWRTLAGVFKENIGESIEERKNFLIKHHLALWDVLKECEINGAADSSIKNAVVNDFSEILQNSKIRRVVFTGRKAAELWKKYCAELYEKRFLLEVVSLPSTSGANAACSLERLVKEYSLVLR